MRYTFLIFLLFGTCIPKESDEMTMIVYTSLVNSDTDHYDVFVMNLDGSGKKNLTNRVGLDWSYGSAGGKIYFVSDRDTTRRIYFLYQMNVHGEEIRRVSNMRLADSWYSFRTGTSEILVKPHRTVDSTLYLLDQKGKLVKRIDTGLPYQNDPLFLPDGQSIVFRGGLFRSKRASGFVDELYKYHLDDGVLVKLTNYPSNDTTAMWYEYRSGPPVWNPRGKFISYISVQNGKHSLFAVTPDASQHWKLTDLKQQEGYHAWSHDNRWLAFEIFDSLQSRYDIALMDWQSKKWTVLTDSTYRYNQAPNFVYVKQ